LSDFREKNTFLMRLSRFQITNVIYLEDKLNKSRQTTLDKLMKRRREDVNDQVIELSSKRSTAQVEMGSAGAEEANRQRRAAEREGRRRRRQQARASQRPVPGMKVA